MFIGGLHPDTNRTELLSYFRVFGEIADVKLIINRETKLSKGYGFLHMNCEKTFKRILEAKHTVKGRRLDCNIACKKTDAPLEIREKFKRKIFVGGLPKNTSQGNLTC